MLKAFEFWLNTEFVFGIGAEKKIGKKIKEHGGHKVLVHFGDGKEMLPEKRAEICAIINAEGIETVELGGVIANPTLGKINEGIKLCKKEGVDFVLGIGGGSVIDSAKAIALGSCYDGDVWDFYCAKTPAVKALPIGAIITYPATGSESSNASVITNEETQQKIGLQCQVIRPCLAIMNPEFTYSLPKKMLASGIADIYSHVVEEYFNNTDDFGSVDNMSEGVFRTIIEIAQRALDNPEDYDSKSELLWMATISNDGLLDVGKIPEWSSHAIGHQLGASYNLNHGVSLSIVMPAWMRYVYKFNVKRFARYAVNVFGIERGDFSDEEVALKGIEATKDFFKSLGMPTSLGEVGIDSERFTFMAQTVLKSKNGPFGSVKRLEQPDIEEIYKLAL